MKKNVLLFFCFLLNQNIFCASPLLKSVLKPREVGMAKEKKVEEFVHKEESVSSPFREIAVAGLEDDLKQENHFPVLNRCYLHPDTGTFGVFNGPWAGRARDFFQTRLREKGSIETFESMRQAIIETKQFIGSEVDKVVKTTGAIVVVNLARQVVWGCFPGDYFLAVQKPEGVTFLTKSFSDQGQVRAAIEIKQFDPHLAAGDKLILSTPDPIGLLLLTKPKKLSVKDLDEAHQQLARIIGTCAKVSNPALGIMERSQQEVEKDFKKSVRYGAKTTLVVATIKDRS